VLITTYFCSLLYAQHADAVADPEFSNMGGRGRSFYTEIMHFCAFLTVICQPILYHDATNDMLFRSGDIGVKVVKLSNFCTILQFS